MPNLPEIKSFYPQDLWKYDRFLLREYLQHVILEIIFSSPFASKLVFIGGTCLRIVHNNQRFSEDLDFDNFGLSVEDFQKVAEHIQKNLKGLGYEVEMRNVFRGAFHCYIKFPGLLFQKGLSNYREEKILIQLDTEAQGFDFQPQTYFLNKFDILSEIFVAPPELLLAQKFLTIFRRKRLKGRDFFDIVFLLAKVKPNYAFLNQKMNISNAKGLKMKVLELCKQIDFQALAKDVEPFLFNNKDLKKVLLFNKYMEQVEL